MGKASSIDYFVLLYGISACQILLLKIEVLIRCRDPTSEILKLFQFQIRRVEMAEKEYFLYIEGKRIEVTEEVYREYYRGERRERYFMEDLKHGRTVTDPETKESRYVPGREDSLERLMESGVQFAETGEGMEERTVTSLLLKYAMELLTPVERELVEELYFLERTEREAGKRLGLAKTTLRRRHREVLDKLRNLLGRCPKDF